MSILHTKWFHPIFTGPTENQNLKKEIKTKKGNKKQKSQTNNKEHFEVITLIFNDFFNVYQVIEAVNGAVELKKKQ